MTWRTGRPRLEPIYELAHGIKVVSENKHAKYVMCRIEAHPFFPDKTILHGRQSVIRSRAVMSAHLGRALLRSEHVHHKKKKFLHRDTIKNLELLTSAEHNKHHKTGTKHSDAAKKKISQTLKGMYDSGIRPKPDLRGKKNPFYGRKHSIATKRQIIRTRKERYG